MDEPRPCEELIRDPQKCGIDCLVRAASGFASMCRRQRRLNLGSCPTERSRLGSLFGA
jgi:hypothetical protein